MLRGRVDYANLDAARRLLDATEGLLGQYEQALGLVDDLAAAVEGEEWEEAVKAGERLLPLAPHLTHLPVWLDTLRQQRVPDWLRNLPPQADDDTMILEKDGKEMIRVPAGKFLYGDEKKERELPKFWMDKTPVTNAEYARFVAATGQEPPEHWKGSTPPDDVADHPVTYVNWHDALAYGEWAGKRLPTEEEWEKAARDADGRVYPWGNKEPTPELCSFGRNEGGTTPVGSYSPQSDSPYGCVDMAGNVWEWTASDHKDGGKLLRGGSWNENPYSARSAYRYKRLPDYRNSTFGFRCAKDSQ